MGTHRPDTYILPMKTKPLSLKLLPALLALFSLAAASSSFADDEVQNHSLDGIAKVDFYTTKSNISIIGSDRSDLELVLVEPLTGFDASKVTQTVNREGDTLFIKIESPKSKSSWWSWNDEHKGYKSATLHVPATLVAKLKTSGGNISAETMDSSVTLYTSGGNLSASRISGQLQAKTSGGNIKVEDVAGTASLKTSGGNISIEGQFTALDAHTSGGNIKANLRSQLSEPLELKTSGGNVSATLVKGMAAPAKLSTSGGSVSIQLPSDQAFELYAKSSGGGVSFDHSGTFQGSIEKTKIEGSVNGGGPLVSLSTSGGSVRIKQL